MKYWKNIKKDERVIETRTGWKVKGNQVYWNGNEALSAQRWLHKRALEDKNKK